MELASQNQPPKLPASPLALPAQATTPRDGRDSPSPRRIPQRSDPCASQRGRPPACAPPARVDRRSALATSGGASGSVGHGPHAGHELRPTGCCEPSQPLTAPRCCSPPDRPCPTSIDTPLPPQVNTIPNHAEPPPSSRPHAKPSCAVPIPSTAQTRGPPSRSTRPSSWASWRSPSRARTGRGLLCPGGSHSPCPPHGVAGEANPKRRPELTLQPVPLPADRVVRQGRPILRGSHPRNPRLRCQPRGHPHRVREEREGLAEEGVVADGGPDPGCRRRAGPPARRGQGAHLDGRP